MDTFENSVPAERQPTMRVGVCWECGAEILCHEYVVCCTGTVFHICPACEEKVRADEGTDAAPEPADAPRSL